LIGIQHTQKLPLRNYNIDNRLKQNTFKNNTTLHVTTITRIAYACHGKLTTNICYFNGKWSQRMIHA